MQHTGRIRFSDSPGQPIIVDAKLDDFDLERAAGKGELWTSKWIWLKTGYCLRICVARPGRRDGTWRPRMGGDHTISEARPNSGAVSALDEIGSMRWQCNFCQGRPRVPATWSRGPDWGGEQQKAKTSKTEWRQSEGDGRAKTKVRIGNAQLMMVWKGVQTSKKVMNRITQTDFQAFAVKKIHYEWGRFRAKLYKHQVFDRVGSVWKNDISQITGHQDM